MRQVVTTLSLVGSFVIFALTIDLFGQVVMFALFGFVPGRSEPLSADQMIGIYAFATLSALLRGLWPRLMRGTRHIFATTLGSRSKTV